MTLDVDATLITAHSEKEKAAGNYKGGYGFHPLQVYLDETREALGGLLLVADPDALAKRAITYALGCSPCRSADPTGTGYFGLSAAAV